MGLWRPAVEVDPLAVTKAGGRAQRQWVLGQYVNERPYAVTSLLSTVINLSADRML